MMRGTFPIALLSSAILAAVVIFAGPALAATTCKLKSIQAAAPADTTITAVEHVDTPIANCKVEGYITTTNPGPGKVIFRVQMPDKNLWNKRFYFMGLGGAAGQTPPAPPKILGSGFVVAVTDTGHQGNTLDWSFMDDKVKALDHLHRGAHVATVASQQIAKAYYGTDKLYRYHVGCSGGGRMGTEAIRNHPEDYDGVLIGGNGDTPPEDIATGSMLKFVQAAQVLNQPGAWLSPDKRKMVDAHVTEACDDTDGAHDGVVWDNRLCHYDVAKLKCKKGDKPDCLTKAEIKSTKAILKGPHGPKGELLADPMPITNMSMWNFNGAGPPPWNPSATPENLKTASSAYVITMTMGAGLIRKNYDVLKDMDYSEKAIQEWDQGFRNGGFGIPVKPAQLEGYEKAGGKFIMWGGISDPYCSFIRMERAYNNAVNAQSADRVAKYYALYGVPGMGHCGGGTGPQDSTDLLLQTLIDWVEKDKAPGPLVTHRGADRIQTPFKAISTTAEAGVPIAANTGESRDFLLCPYPMVSVFDKSKAKVAGAVNDAANWSCRSTRE